MKIGERELSQEELQRVKVRIQVETLLDNEVIDSEVKAGDQVYICLGNDDVKAGKMHMHQTMVCSDSFLVAAVDTLFKENPWVLLALMEELQAKMCAKQHEKRVGQ